jgi:hypothetical protein
MVRPVPFIIASLLVCVVCDPAFADQGVDAVPDMLSQLAHWGITLLGLAVAARLAWQAFGRAVPWLTSLPSRGT